LDDIEVEINNYDLDFLSNQYFARSSLEMLFAIGLYL
jgi:hypothetical protein